MTENQSNYWFADSLADFEFNLPMYFPDKVVIDCY